MNINLQRKWPLGMNPSLSSPVPSFMDALTIHRDHYGQPKDSIRYEEVTVPKLKMEEANCVLVAILATGPNFNTNFAAMGLPVPPFGRGDSETLHIPGSDALGIIVDAGPAVKNLKVGQAVIMDSWTDAGIIRGYETHDGFNAQFAVVDQARALPIPQNLGSNPPEQLAAMLLTYGTAYRAVVERLQVKPGESLLLMGGGKGTSFAGAQIAKKIGAQVILMGSNRDLADNLIRRGIADAFVNRRDIPQEVYGVIPTEENFESWMKKTEPFRETIFKANGGNPVDKIFEHTGGINFPLLVSCLADNGCLAFFGATGSGLKGEYKETFFYDHQRLVMDARWVWMRQKQLLLRSGSASDIFSEIQLLPGKKGLIWGADNYAQEFAKAALSRSSELVVIASRQHEREGISELMRLGIRPGNIIDRDQFELVNDMPDPLTPEGTLNPDYNEQYMTTARSLGRAIWKVFGPRTSPDFIVERLDQSTLHYSSFLARDFNEDEDMNCGIIVAKGSRNLTISGSHMYRSSQAQEVIRLLDQKKIEMEKEDLEVVSLQDLPLLQQMMLDGTMQKPKGVALVQAEREGQSINDYVSAFLGETVLASDQEKQEYLDIHLSSDDIAIIFLKRMNALNALNDDLLGQISVIFNEIKTHKTLKGRAVKAVILSGSDRAFVAGADVTEFIGKSAEEIAQIANYNLSIFNDIEQSEIPIISLVDGFALGGGNELAMSTHYRIVTENAQLGQPEVKLGIIPGYGGAQRLPRLVGPRKALEMSVNGEPVGGREALKIGLADEYHLSSTALSKAYQVALEFTSGSKVLNSQNWDQLAGQQKDELETLLHDKSVLEIMSCPDPSGESIKDIRTARTYAARFVIDAMIHGYENGFLKGLENDAKLFGTITASASGQEWVQRFVNKDPQQSSFLTILTPKTPFNEIDQ